MAIKKADKPFIDLRGPGGNAFAIIGQAKVLCKQLGRSEDFEGIQERMMSGDFENLIQVFDQEFGEYIDLIR